MPSSGLWLRVFVALLWAVLPPILLIVGTLLLTESVLREADPYLVAVLVVLGAIVWGAILAVVYSRSLGEDLRSFLTLAERGDEVHAEDASAAYQQVASALDERNRQIAALAREASRVPIDDSPIQVVRAVVSATRAVTKDATWRAAILTSKDEGALPPGIYLGIDDDADPLPLSDLERWASVTHLPKPASRLDGPWGAFAIVNASSGDRLSAILYAPWEGRAELTPAERAMLTLVGQQAATALDHSALYARVRSQADELNRLAAVQSDFLRSVTHDLQTPLTSIGALATELRADDTMPESARTDLDTISHQADRLRRMVGQLLVASRLEAGAFAPQVEVFSIRPLVERTWAALRADRPLTIDIEGPPHLAVADPDRVEQVLWALLDNAVKYSPAGSPISVLVHQGNGVVAVSIVDRGIGMDGDTEGRAFDQFFRSSHARRIAPDGSGVGLYACRGLIEAMGGSIEAAGTLGEGTTITFRVPAEASDESAA